MWDNGNRYCKPCRNAGMKAWYERHKEEISAERKAKRKQAGPDRRDRSNDSGV